MTARPTARVVAGSVALACAAAGAVGCARFGEDAEGADAGAVADGAVAATDGAAVPSPCARSSARLCDDFEDRASPDALVGSAPWRVLNPGGGTASIVGPDADAPSKALRITLPATSDGDTVGLETTLELGAEPTVVVRARIRIPENLSYVRILDFTLGGRFYAVVVQNGELVAQVGSSYTPTAQRAPVGWSDVGFHIVRGADAELRIGNASVWRGPSDVNADTGPLRLVIGPRAAETAPFDGPKTFLYDDVVVE